MRILMTNTNVSPGRRTFLAMAGATLATLGSRRASAQAAKPLSFQLSWIKSIQYGGYFGGLDIGSFKAASVDATFVSGGPNMDPVANVAAGNSQLGDRPSGALLLARDHDIPIRIIGAVFQKSPYSLISLASKPIATVKDMVGKTIAVPTSGRPLVVYLLQAAGLDTASVNLVPASPDPAGLVAGQIDGYMGYSTNQGVMLQTRGVDIHVLNAQDNGLPDAAGVIYGRQDFLQANRPLVVDFLRGAIKGWQWALSHPEQDAHLMVEKYGAPGLKYEAQHSEIVASKPYVEAGLGSRQGLLALDMDLFGNMIEVYRKVGMISGKWGLSDLCDPSFIDEAHKA
jgi:ABC-type nitrate/sulfonate/bicarbonate transport system substrate-binding protein